MLLSSVVVVSSLKKKGYKNTILKGLFYIKRTIIHWDPLGHWEPLYIRWKLKAKLKSLKFEMKIIHVSRYGIYIFDLLEYALKYVKNNQYFKP